MKGGCVCICVYMCAHTPVLREVGYYTCRLTSWPTRCVDMRGNFPINANIATSAHNLGTSQNHCTVDISQFLHPPSFVLSFLFRAVHEWLTRDNSTCIYRNCIISVHRNCNIAIAIILVQRVMRRIIRTSM